MSGHTPSLMRLEQKAAEADQIIEYLKHQVQLLKEKASKWMHEACMCADHRSVTNEEFIGVSNIYTIWDGTIIYQGENVLFIIYTYLKV